MQHDTPRPLRYGTLLFAGFIALIEVVPYLWMLLTSLKPLKEVLQFPPTLLPSSFQWDNYVQVWNSAPFTTYILNSLFVAVAIMVIQGVLSCLAGYAFARLEFRGRDVLFMLVIACLMIPAQVRFISVYLLLSDYQLIDTYTAQILPHAASALGIFLMRQAFLAIPQDLIDAAKVDGAGTLRIIFQIMLPQALPTLTAFLLFSFVFHWNDYFWPLVVAYDESIRPLPLGVAMLRESGTGSPWHLIMAGNVILVLPLLVAFALAQKKIIQAFAFTSMK